MSFAASVAPSSKADAMRAPVPVITRAIALPELQPERPTISCTMLARLGVRWLGPAWWTVVHAAGAQATVAVVRGRLETLPVVDANAVALSLAWPAIVSCVGVDVSSSAVNCTYADVMVAPAGIV